MKDDPAFAWLRKVRREISAEFGHDPKRLVEHYIKLQERHKDRLVKARIVTNRDDAARKVGAFEALPAGRQGPDDEAREER